MASPATSATQTKAAAQGTGRRRRRLGVALLVDPPVATEVDGLRRALGDGSLGKIAPHLTLVPPVNVAERDLADALASLRGAAAGQKGPLELTLGPVASFDPASPVIYLVVGAGGKASGAGPLEALATLHDSVLSGPLSRPLRWPWVPHVTLLDEAPPSKIEAATTALASYRAEAVFDRVVLLQEREHLWAPIADAVLGPPAVVGRGGLDLEIWEGRLAGPDVLQMVEAAGQLAAWEAALGAAVQSEVRGDIGATLVLTGRRAGAVAGVAVAWIVWGANVTVHAGVFVSPPERGIGVGRALLGALEATVRERGWPSGKALGYGPTAFYEHCGGWVRRG